jgi:hypothetical protein
VHFECYSKCGGSEHPLGFDLKRGLSQGRRVDGKTICVRFECYSKCSGSECLLGPGDGRDPELRGIAAFGYGNVLDGRKGTELARLRREQMPLPAFYADAVRAPLPNE